MKPGKGRLHRTKDTLGEYVFHLTPDGRKFIYIMSIGVTRKGKDLKKRWWLCRTNKDVHNIHDCPTYERLCDAVADLEKHPDYVPDVPKKKPFMFLR